MTHRFRRLRFALRARLKDALLARFLEAASAPVRRRYLVRSRLHPRREAMRVVCGDGTVLHADVYRAQPEAGAASAPTRNRGTVIVAHGYRDGRHQLAFLARPLTARGYRVIAFDFRAHGKSGGARITIGAREAEDVRAVLAAARDLERDRRGQVVFFGFSMGASAYLLAGVEADLAVLDSPYDTLEEAVLARTRKLRLPASVASAVAAAGARRFGIDFATVRPIDGARVLTRPTLFVFAERDPWIGQATRDAFARVLPACASLRVVPGGHRFHFAAQWQAMVIAFMTGREHEFINT